MATRRIAGRNAAERNAERTAYLGGLDAQVTEEVVWELMTQAGSVADVYLPKDRVTGQHQGYGFVEFETERDVEYAVRIMNMIQLHGKPIRVHPSAQEKGTPEVGANLFVGNLDPQVDEKTLYDTFSAFGTVLHAGVPKDAETGQPKGYGFVNYAEFEASDAAIEGMNGQYLCNRPVTVNYAFKKDTKGERHGSEAERLLAAQRKRHGTNF